MLYSSQFLIFVFLQFRFFHIQTDQSYGQWKCNYFEAPENASI